MVSIDPGAKEEKARPDDGGGLGATPTGASCGSVSADGATLVPSSDPNSDPDAALYAAVRARPDWTEKPAAKAALQELARGLASGEDPLFWQVSKPGPTKESDAREHLSVVVVDTAEAGAKGSTGLESRRLYVAPEADPRRALTVRSPGRNGPAPTAAGGLHVSVVVTEPTLLSPGTRRPSSRPPPADAARGRSRRWPPIAAAGAAVIAVGIGLARTLAPVSGPTVASASSAGAVGSMGDDAAAVGATAGLSGAGRMSGRAAPSVGAVPSPATVAPVLTAAAVSSAGTGTPGTLPAPSSLSRLPSGVRDDRPSPPRTVAPAKSVGVAPPAVVPTVPPRTPIVAVDTAPPVASSSAPAAAVATVTPPAVKSAPGSPESRPEF